MINEAIREKVTKEEAPSPPPTRIARANSNTSPNPTATTSRAVPAKHTPAVAAATKATTATKTPAIRARATKKTPVAVPVATTKGDKLLGRMVYPPKSLVRSICPKSLPGKPPLEHRSQPGELREEAAEAETAPGRGQRHEHDPSYFPFCLYFYIFIYP